ncbi:uncharacterized protein LOC135705669 [Ochlerotatus camptorhynchus]|uniref:uncharacterized protein LOC135705669 n=1 Tax=Ochlerotatus camptorhynchus TaxID=644619 RepID=UPI0031E3A60D
MSFDVLPAEILQKIFDYIPGVEQLQKTAISRRWNRLTLRETYLILAYGEQVISERILRRTQRGYCCFSIEFSEAYAVLKPRLQICAEKFFLRKLILDGIQTYALVQFVKEYRNWLRGVVHLSVTLTNQVDSGSEDDHLDLPRLRVLSWTCGTEGGSPVLPKFTLNAPALEDVYVECADTDRTPLVLEHTTNLKSLGIFVPKLIPAMCPNGLLVLDCLRIYNSMRPFSWDPQQFGLPRLTVLELCGCTVNNESISSLQHFPNLETLIIQTETTNLINLHIIANSLPKLKQLRLFDVKWTHNADILTFPALQVLDVNDTVQTGDGWPLEINAPHLITLKGTAFNLLGFELTNPVSVKCMIMYGLYLNYFHPRLFASVMILHIDVPCDNRQLMITECIHQFPNLTRLTLVLHEKQSTVSINGHLLAISFIHLRYLHLRNFDLDYNFLVGMGKCLKLRTLVLQDGTLNVTPDDRPVYFSDQQLFFLQNVKIPKDVTSFPVFNPPTKMILSLADGNVFSTLKWDEKNIKSAEDYVTFLLW